MLTLKSDLAAAARRVEALPPGDAAFATISNTILRLLVRQGQLEERPTAKGEGGSKRPQRHRDRAAKCGWAGSVTPRGVPWRGLSVSG